MSGIQFVGFNFASAAEYTSLNFKVLDPVISDGGGRSTSGSFQLERSVAQPAIGISTALGFIIKAGFLYFSDAAPSPTPTPTPTPTPATPSPGFLGPATPPPIYIPPAPILPIPIIKCGVADFNCDGIVDLADFSAYLYLSGYAPHANPADLNNDGGINLADASVLFYYWSDTGININLPTYATRPVVEIGRPSLTGTLGESGQASIIPQGAKKLFFGIQEEGRSLIESTTTKISAFFDRIWDTIKAVIIGFWHFVLNIVQLK